MAFGRRPYRPRPELLGAPILTRVPVFVGHAADAVVSGAADSGVAGSGGRSAPKLRRGLSKG